ncbi:MAG: twin-arginine translocase TatA/TatE family subunit [Candidatus Bathyarchaeia archaeon]
MAFLGPWEIALIVVILLVLFGPKKLPELAQSLGKAVREYRRATSALEELAEEPVKTISRPFTVEGAPPKPEARVGAAKSPASALEAVGEKSPEETLAETAKKLGIDTEGKTPEQIAEEILKLYKATPKAEQKP